MFSQRIKQLTSRRRPEVADGRPSKSATQINKYRFELTDQQIAQGEHRKKVGPHWDRIGRLQFDYLVAEGLKRDSLLLDVGCGALRGGIHFVDYLEPAHYFGIDLNSSLVRAGLEHEIPRAGLQTRLPAGNLKVTDTFECDFGERFDFVLAQSLFTHLPLNHIRLCLHQVAKVTEPGARFYATFFEAPEGTPYDEPVPQTEKVTTYSDRDSYHYRPSELQWAAGAGPWRFHYRGDWDHPRNQKMAVFERMTDTHLN